MALVLLPMRLTSLIIVCLLGLLLTAEASAQSPCPDRNGIPDFNCDGRVQVVVLGDSLVAGVGDSDNRGRGGYILRSAARLREIVLFGYGVPGQQTRQLLSSLEETLRPGVSSVKAAAIRNADIVVLDLGRNDRWLFGLPAATWRNLSRIRDLVRSRGAAQSESGLPPLVVIASLMLPNRGSQGPWVRELNEIILRKHSRSAPTDLRFDLVSKRLLASDQIHPTSAGYGALTTVFTRYLTRTLPPRMRKLRPDADGDGVPDILERP